MKKKVIEQEREREKVAYRVYHIRCEGMGDYAEYVDQRDPLGSNGRRQQLGGVLETHVRRHV